MLNTKTNQYHPIIITEDPASLYLDPQNATQIKYYRGRLVTYHTVGFDNLNETKKTIIDVLTNEINAKSCLDGLVIWDGVSSPMNAILYIDETSKGMKIVQYTLPIDNFSDHTT